MKRLPSPGNFRPRDHLPLFSFLLFYFLFSLATYRDYGVGWDEYTLYSRGSVLWDALFGRGNWVGEFLVNGGKEDGWALYNYWYPMVLSFLNRGFSMEYFHWLNLCSASLVFAASYVLLYSRYASGVLALLGPIFLFLTPRFLGYLPFDCKDTSFAIFYFLGLAAIFLGRGTGGWGRTLTLGVLLGLAQSLRLAGASLFFVWALFEWAERARGKIPMDWRSLGSQWLQAGALSLLVMTATWPYLRVHPVLHFQELLGMSVRFPMKIQFLFRGAMVSSDHLPWYYLPGWILVSAPIFILGLLAAIPWSVRKPLENPLWVLVGITLAVNGVLVLLLRPSAYLDARHFLYLLPVLNLWACISAAEFWLNFRKRGWWKPAVFLSCFGVLAPAFHMVRLHPYEYVYFNELEGGLAGAYGRYEIEELGTSAKEAVEWLKAHQWIDPERTYFTESRQDRFQMAYYLPPNVKLGGDRADTLVILPFNGRHQLRNRLLYSVTREGVPLMDIYKK